MLRPLLLAVSALILDTYATTRRNELIVEDTAPPQARADSDEIRF